jgi:urease accessory protein
MLVFGRRAMGEWLTGGCLRDTWRINQAGRLLWHDALALEGDLVPLLAAPAGFAGAAAAATLVYAGRDAAGYLAAARQLCLTETSVVRSAATLVNGVLILRALAGDARALRDWQMAAWRRLRRDIARLPPVVPRVWLI